MSVKLRNSAHSDFVTNTIVMAQTGSDLQFRDLGLHFAERVELVARIKYPLTQTSCFAERYALLVDGIVDKRRKECFGRVLGRLARVVEYVLDEYIESDALEYILSVSGVFDLFVQVRWEKHTGWTLYSEDAIQAMIAAGCFVGEGPVVSCHLLRELGLTNNDELGISARGIVFEHVFARCGKGCDVWYPEAMLWFDQDIMEVRRLSVEKGDKSAYQSMCSYLDMRIKLANV